LISIIGISVSFGTCFPSTASSVTSSVFFRLLVGLLADQRVDFAGFDRLDQVGVAVEAEDFTLPFWCWPRSAERTPVAALS